MLILLGAFRVPVCGHPARPTGWSACPATTSWSAQRILLLLHLIGVCVCIVLCLGCAGERDRTPPLPKMDAVRSRLKQPQQNTPSTDFLKGFIYVTQLVLPLEEPTDTAWGLTEANQLDPSVIEAWNANGLRVGVLNQDSLEVFLDAIPAAQITQRRRMTVGRLLTPLTASPAYDRAVRFWVVPPPVADGVEETMRLGSGRSQFLVRLVNNPDGDGPVLDLMPHYYRSRETIVARNPRDKALDGVIFDRLALRVDWPNDGHSILVVGLRVPSRDSDDSKEIATPEPVEPATTVDVDSAATTQPTDVTGPPRLTADDLPNNLGKLTFTALRFKKPVQLFLLIVIGE